MNENEKAIANHIITTMALAVLRGEGGDESRRELLTRFGEYGFEIAEMQCDSTMKWLNRDHKLLVPPPVALPQYASVGTFRETT